MTTRVFTGIILAVTMAAIILLAPVVVFKSLVLVVAGLALNEYMGIVLKKGNFLYHWVIVGIGVLLAAMVVFHAPLPAVAFVLVFGIFAAAMIQMYHATTLEETTSRLGLASFGLLYICMTLPFLGWIREMEHGRTILFMALGAAAMGDTFAMLAGKTIGGRKMSPLTSPNKTWAGFIAGFFGSAFAVWVFKMLLWRELSLLHVAALGVLVGLTGPLGDLIESMLKRDYHIKDSGTLIPGHGGILDRIDAQIFTGPAVFFYAKWFIL